MKCQYFCEPPIGKLVHQILSDVTFAYDVRLGCLRDHSKGFIKEKNIKNVLDNSFSYGTP